MMKRLAQMLLTIGLLLFGLNGRAQDGSGKIPYRYATQAEAQMLITEIDPYTNGWNQFDLDVRLQTPQGKKSKLLALGMESTRSWNEADKEKMDKAFKLVETALRKQKLDLPFPAEIVLVKTSMAEEGGATAYTREHWMAIGEYALEKASVEDMARLVAHELFHILTRNDASLKKKTYSVIGFTVAERAILFPSDLAQKMISNPDVSRHDSYAPFTIDGVTRNCVLVVYTSKPYTEGSLFQYMQVGLVPLDEQLVPLQEDGSTLIYAPGQASDFPARMQRNTSYVIDPEEVLADNFMHVLFPADNLSDPQLVEDLKQVLQAGS